MSGRRRSPRYPGGSKEPAKPKGYSEDAVLSEEEVQRRVDVLGGGTPQAPPVTQRLRDRRPTPVAARPGRARARDVALLLGLALVGLLAILVLLPDGPLSARSSASPATASTQAAFAPSLGPASSAPAGTPSLITLPPSSAVPVGATEPPPTPTVEPRPTATLAPATTRPTPKPTPNVTPKPTAPPTVPPTATLLVQVAVLNGDGGTAQAGDWIVTVKRTPGTSISFAGSSAGTLITLRTGIAYSVTASGPSGYLQSRSVACSSSSVVGGSSGTCTILLNDRKPTITVYTIVDNTGGGTLTPADITVTVTGVDVTPTMSFPGTSSGLAVHVRAFTAYSIEQTGAPGEYSPSTVTPECAGTGLALGESVTCTVTFTYTASPGPPAPTPTSGLLLPLALVARALRGRRRWTVIRIR